MTTPHERYLELTARVDGFFDDVHARHGERMQCGAGCADCCRSRFSVTLVEAVRIAEGLAGLPADVRARLRERADQGDPGVCAALEPDGRCAIYAWRPLICRSHGVPIRQREADGEARLPVIDVCPKNFRGVVLAGLETGVVLDQATVSTVLGAIDAALADESGVPRGTRIELAELVGYPERYFDMAGDDT